MDRVCMSELARIRDHVWLVVWLIQNPLRSHGQDGFFWGPDACAAGHKIASREFGLLAALLLSAKQHPVRRKDGSRSDLPPVVVNLGYRIFGTQLGTPGVRRDCW